jgi:fructose-1,6-bisphosphatase
MNNLITLDEFIIRRQKDFPFASGELSGLLRDIGLASKIISREVNKAGLADITGIAGNENSSGEAQQNMLVYTTGKGVNGFTLDPSIGEFCLSHPDIRLPVKADIYSVNHSAYREFEPGVKKFIDDCIEDAFKFRYIGSMVADVHRTLLKGGIFMYPGTEKATNGKLRLLYECNPLSFIMEQAGGKASDGKTRILEQKAEKLHQRTPVYIGSSQLVEKVEKLIQETKVNN